MPGHRDQLGRTEGAEVGSYTPAVLTDDDPLVIGFFGATPVERPSVRAAATTNAQTITLANDLRAALIALGLVS